MSDYTDYDREAAEERRLRMELDGSAFSYLAHYGDAIEARVTHCIQEAERLLAAGFPGPALTRATTAIELTIRFYLVQPLMGAALRDTGIGDLILERALPSGPRGPSADRDLLPRLLREWEIDITQYRAQSGDQLWEQIAKTIVDARNRYVHSGDDVDTNQAGLAVSCAKQLLTDVVEPLAARLGFTRAATGLWHKIAGDPELYPPPHIRYMVSTGTPF